MSSVLGLVSICFLLVAIVSAEHLKDSINVLHRLFHPVHAPADSFVTRGSLRLDSTASPQSVGAQQHLEHLFSTYDVSTDSSWLYQVALERPRELDVSSIKACHLTLDTLEQFIVHISPHTQTPHGIDYFVYPTPSDGSCPSVSSGRSIGNTTVVLKSASVPPAPVLKEAPKLSADGEVVKPLPEKSFIEKYWMYIAGVLFALALSGGGEEPKK